MIMTLKTNMLQEAPWLLSIKLFRTCSCCRDLPGSCRPASPCNAANAFRSTPGVAAAAGSAAGTESRPNGFFNGAVPPVTFFAYGKSRKLNKHVLACSCSCSCLFPACLLACLLASFHPSFVYSFVLVSICLVVCLCACLLGSPIV